jgi:hypothetical protein
LLPDAPNQVPAESDYVPLLVASTDGTVLLVGPDGTMRPLELPQISERAADVSSPETRGTQIWGSAATPSNDLNPPLLAAVSPLGNTCNNHQQHLRTRFRVRIIPTCEHSISFSH